MSTSFEAFNQLRANAIALSKVFDKDLNDALEAVGEAAEDATKAIEELTDKIGRKEKVEEQVEKSRTSGFSNFLAVAKRGAKLMKGLGKVFKDIVGQFVNFNSVMESLGMIFEPLQVLIDTFAAGIELGLAPVFAELMAIITDPAVMELMIELGRLFGTVLSTALSVLAGVVQALVESGILEVITEGVQFLTGALQGIQGPITEVTANITEFFLNFATNWNDFWNTRKSEFDTWRTGVATDWKNFWDTREAEFNDFVSKSQEDWNNFVDEWNDFWDRVGSIAAERWDSFVGNWNGFWGTLIAGFDSEFVDNLTAAWDAFWAGDWDAALDNIGDALSAAWDAVLAAFESVGIDLTWVWDNVLAPLWAGILVVFEGLAWGIASFINLINDMVQELDIFDVIDDFSVTVPSFAEGKIVMGPQLAVVGDNPARREAIVPLERAGEFGFGGGIEDRRELEIHTDLLMQIAGNTRRRRRRAR